MKHLSILLLALFTPLFVFSQSKAEDFQVIFYPNANFSGNPASFKFKTDNAFGFVHSVGSAAGMGVKNDDMESVRVGKGCKLTVYNDANLGGARIVFCEGDYTGLPNNWANYMSSYKIEKLNPKKSKTVMLYSDALGNYTYTRKSSVTVGDWNVEDFTNDDISAIDVPKGVKVFLYKDKDFKGKPAAFEGIQDKPMRFILSEYAFNDQVSSIKVENLQYELVSIVYSDRKETGSDDKKVVGGKFTTYNKTNANVETQAELAKDFTNTISQTTESTSTNSIESSVTTSVSGKIFGVGASAEISLVTRFENSVMQGKTDEQSETTSFKQTVTPTVLPNSRKRINILAKESTVTYNVTRTYKLLKEEFKEVATIQLKISTDFEAVIEDVYHLPIKTGITMVNDAKYYTGDDKYFLEFESRDGSLVVGQTEPDKLIWESRNNKKFPLNAKYARLQLDGNFVLLNEKEIWMWDAKTQIPNSTLNINSKGELAVIDPSGKEIWNAKK